MYSKKQVISALLSFYSVPQPFNLHASRSNHAVAAYREWKPLAPKCRYFMQANATNLSVLSILFHPITFLGSAIQASIPLYPHRQLQS